MSALFRKTREALGCCPQGNTKLLFESRKGLLTALRGSGDRPGRGKAERAGGDRETVVEWGRRTEWGGKPLRVTGQETREPNAARRCRSSSSEQSAQPSGAGPAFSCASFLPCPGPRSSRGRRRRLVWDRRTAVVGWGPEATSKTRLELSVPHPPPPRVGPDPGLWGVSSELSTSEEGGGKGPGSYPARKVGGSLKCLWSHLMTANPIGFPGLLC